MRMRRGETPIQNVFLISAEYFGQISGIVLNIARKQYRLRANIPELLYSIYISYIYFSFHRDDTVFFCQKKYYRCKHIFDIIIEISNYNSF